MKNETVFEILYRTPEGKAGLKLVPQSRLTAVTRSLNSKGYYNIRISFIYQAK